MPEIFRRTMACTNALSPCLLLAFAVSVAAQVSPPAAAQTPAVPGPEQTSPASSVAIASLPNAPDPQFFVPSGAQANAHPATPGPPAQHASGNISGTVTDANGSVVPGATVVLEGGRSVINQTQLSDVTGFFNFVDVEPGTFKVTITATGFAAWVELGIPLLPGEDYDMPPIVLRVASASTDVAVIFSQHDLAEEQLKAQEKQRVMGFYPNFYASYVWNAAPLSPGQKLRLAWRSAIDPLSFVSDGFTAGFEQAQNAYPGYGQGAQGYAKRFGAAYADDFIGTMIGGALLPSLLRQDPRYFYKGSGSIRSRVLYAMATTVICKGDNGHWQPNYSNLLGGLAAGGISNVYYPEGNRNDAATTIDNTLIGLGSGAASALIQEFLLHHITAKAIGNGKP